MGTETRYLIFKDCTTRDSLIKAWRERVKEDQFDKGHGLYQGSIAHCDPDVLKRMARRVRASWQLCSGIDTDRLEAMSLRGQTVRSETLRNHELITGLQAIAAIAISAAKDLANGYPERELAMPLDQIKAAAAKLGVH